MFSKLTKKVITLVMLGFALVASLFSASDAVSYSVRDVNSIKLNFAAISDTHLTDSAFRSFLLSIFLEDVNTSKTKVDAIVVSGDLTDHGYEEQWNAFKNTFAEYNTVENVILSSGNHDTWVESDVAADYIDLFTETVSEIGNIETETPYYSTQVNGYTFVVIGSEGTLGEKMIISETQLEWLDETMSEAAEDGKPIFVISHNAINGTHGLPATWGDDEMMPDDGGIGDQSDEVEAILKSYENVFLISGHIHAGFGDELTEKIDGFKSIENDGSFHSINLPSYMYANIVGNFVPGQGFQFEVYDDCVIIRGRNYMSGLWHTHYEYEIPLV